jgi:hypothetical protein
MDRATSLVAMTDLYDTDILEWSEHQAALLRRVAGGERLNNTYVDWPNIIDEVESVGRSQLSAVRSLPIRALAHALKAKAWPLCREVGAAGGCDAASVATGETATRELRGEADRAALQRDAATTLRAVMRPDTLRRAEGS